MLIGFAGKARSGKDTAAKYLVEKYGFNQIALADPVKQGSYNLNPWIYVSFNEYRVLKLAEIEDEFYGDFVKLQVLINFLGVEKAKTIREVREFYQKYGTDAGRNIHGETCWLNLAKKALTGKDVISDIRFSNEAEFIRDNGGVVVNLARSSAETVNQHVSEVGLCSEYYDYYIDNNGTIEDLYLELDKIIK